MLKFKPKNNYVLAIKIKPHSRDSLKSVDQKSVIIIPKWYLTSYTISLFPQCWLYKSC